MRQQRDEEYDPDLDYEPDPGSPDGPPVDPAQVQHYIDLLRSRQHVPMALLGGLLGAVLGAAAWLGMSALLDLQVGWMAIVVGALVGVLMRFLGRGIDLQVSIAAVLFAALGMAAGDLASGCAAAARQSRDLGFLDQVARLNLDSALAILKGSLEVLDLVFRGTGLVVAFLVSRRRVRARAILKQAQRLREAA